MIGNVIGNYLITSELAKGGMGAVYRGRHQNLPREVVVKSILLSSFPAQAQQQLKARFVREAYIQSQLDHPNIVRVFEFFTSTENYYLVMEFVNGMSLRDLIKRQGAIAPGQALPLFKQALSALDYAHNFEYVDESGRQHKGIIHRDIKPANMLLDGMARLKLTDFGIVKLAGESSMTRTGFNPGTVEYMSPEQIRGLEVDARSDIYSLGITFYEALTGRVPFPYSESASEYEVFKKHIEIAPPPIPEFQSNVPAAMAAIVMRALEKNPEDRFSTSSDFLSAFLDYEGDGVSIGQPSQKAFSVQPQLTHSITEQLGAPTQPAPLTAESEPAIPTHPNNLRHQPKSGVSSAADAYQTTMPAPRSKRSGLIAFAAIAILLIGSAAIYYLLQQPGARLSNPASSTATPETSATIARVQENPQLKQARELEQQENYTEAIGLYEEYVKANPQSADSSAISAQVSALKKLQGLLTVAELEMKQRDFSAARRDYSDALKLRPESKRAKNGLAEAEAQLAGAR